MAPPGAWYMIGQLGGGGGRGSPSCISYAPPTSPMGGQLIQVVYLSQLLGSFGAFHGGVVGPSQLISFHVVNLAKVLSSLG
jgi:hypothetical protein